MDLVGVLIMLGVILLVAFLVESLVEYLLGEPFNHFPALEGYKWVLMYFAGAAGVAMAFIYGFDLVYILSQFLAEVLGGTSPIMSVTPAGTIVTGLGIGRGAGFIHGVVQSYFKKPELVLGEAIIQ